MSRPRGPSGSDRDPPWRGGREGRAPGGVADAPGRACWGRRPRGGAEEGRGKRPPGPGLPGSEAAAAEVDRCPAVPTYTGLSLRLRPGPCSAAGRVPPQRSPPVTPPLPDARPSGARSRREGVRRGLRCARRGGARRAWPRRACCPRVRRRRCHRGRELRAGRRGIHRFILKMTRAARVVKSFRS